ncbi:MAG: hypothetical protein A2V65_06010 [Deltaproteobacteria bacterium RBG_13_49_15]|nr:MAG: hypothetical protein A2V65_06010 [Deltaproteobacteria bacterium RBG_13_49_15]
MGLKKKPVFRKIIIPWYDSVTACAMLLFFMFAVFLFGVVGISVSFDSQQYHGYAWVPALLILLSGIVIVRTSTRMARLITGRF